MSDDQVAMDGTETADRLVSFREAAGRLSVSIKTLERRVAASEFPVPLKFGGLRMYAVSTLNAEIERIKGVAS